MTEIPSVFLLVLTVIKDDQRDQNCWMIDWLLPWQLLQLALIIDLSWFILLLISCDLIDFAAFSVSCRNLHDCTCRGCRGAGAGWAGLPGLRLWSRSARSRWQQWCVLQPEGGQTRRGEVIWVVARDGADAHEHGRNEPQGRRHQTFTTSKRTPLYHHQRLCLGKKRPDSFKDKLFLWKKKNSLITSVLTGEGITWSLYRSLALENHENRLSLLALTLGVRQTKSQRSHSSC